MSKKISLAEGWAMYVEEQQRIYEAEHGMMDEERAIIDAESDACWSEWIRFQQSMQNAQDYPYPEDFYGEPYWDNFNEYDMFEDYGFGTYADYDELEEKSMMDWMFCEEEEWTDIQEDYKKEKKYGRKSRARRRKQYQRSKKKLLRTANRVKKNFYSRLDEDTLEDKLYKRTEKANRVWKAAKKKHLVDGEIAA